MPYFRKRASDRQHLFWQRDALAQRMGSRAVVEQKLRYIHHNPLQERWSLSSTPKAYRWSSARYYLTSEDEFSILTHYREVF